MKPKRVISLLSAAALSVALCLPTSAAARFEDIAGHPAESAIEQFAKLKILNGDGDGNFAPQRTITRAEMCAILDRIFTFPDRSENTFSDLDDDQWYTDNMLRANAAGVILGDGGSQTIRPHDAIRWDEALTMIGRAFRLAEDPQTPLPAAVPDWAQGYIGAMWSAGWLGEEFTDPFAPFTRGDAVTVLNAVVSDLGWQAAGKVAYSTYLVPILPDVPVLSYDTDAFYREEDGRLRYDDGTTPVAYGIDVSAHQRSIDWQAVADDGIQFAMLRLGFRGYGSAGTLNMDSCFEENLTGALEAGLDIGIYFFSQAVSVQEALDEAQFLLEHLEGRELTYPVVYDWENISGAVARTDQVDNDTLNACALAFCDAIAQAGYQPMVYFNTHQALLQYDLSLLTDYPFWYAYYTTQSTPALYYDFRMWQYTSSGSVAGIQGNVDMDICFYPFGMDLQPEETSPEETPLEEAPPEETPPENAPAEDISPQEAPAQDAQANG